MSSNKNALDKNKPCTIIHVVCSLAWPTVIRRPVLRNIPELPTKSQHKNNVSTITGYQKCMNRHGARSYGRINAINLPPS